MRVCYFDELYTFPCRNNFEFNELYTSPCRNNFEFNELYTSPCRNNFELKYIRSHCKNKSLIHKNTRPTTRGANATALLYFPKLFCYFLQRKPYDFISWSVYEKSRF